MAGATSLWTPEEGESLVVPPHRTAHSKSDACGTPGSRSSVRPYRTAGLLLRGSLALRLFSGPGVCKHRLPRLWHMGDPVAWPGSRLFPLLAQALCGRRLGAGVRVGQM